MGRGAMFADEELVGLLLPLHVMSENPLHGQPTHLRVTLGKFHEVANTLANGEEGALDSWLLGSKMRQKHFSKEISSNHGS